jgi:hypothetical protein
MRGFWPMMHEHLACALLPSRVYGVVVHGRNVMKSYRISMAMLMGAVAVAAVDFWVIRSVEMSSVMQFFFATGAMPVASLLIVIGLVSVPQLLRSGEISPFVIGFEAAGWMAVFGFIAWYSVAPEYAADCVQPIAEAIRPPRATHFRALSDLPGLLLEFGVIATLFSLPQLLLALLGGWLAHRVGLTARFSLAADRARENQER